MRWLQRVLRFTLVLGVGAGAQTDPSLRWRSLPTPHFQVVFSDGLEETARRAAGSAERAYAALALDLHPPRGPITIVVADNLDISNGYATNFPTNRIVIYARPTVDAGSLRFLDDWIDLVVVHELAHLFQLDRARGLWAAGQKVFGRNPFLFPHAYTPSWLVEGIAVHYETKLTGAGRLAGTDFAAIARAHDLGGRPPALNALSGGSPLFPPGSIAYAYGASLVNESVNRGRPNGMRDYVDGTAAWLLPFMLNANAKRGFGATFDSTFRLWSDSTHRAAQRIAAGMVESRPIVTGGWFSSRPRWVGNDTIEFGGFDAKSLPAQKRVAATGGSVTTVGVRNSIDRATLLPDGSRVFAQQELIDAYTQRSDLYIERRGTVRRLTRGARLLHPDARMCDGAPVPAPPAEGDICIVAVQLLPGAARLAHVRLRAGARDVEIAPLTPPSADELFSEPRWSHAGDRIAATHWSRGGTSAIDILDATGRIVFGSIGRARAVTGSPAWGPGDSTIYFTSDRGGRSAIYRANVATGAMVRVAESATGFFENEPSPDGARIATFQLARDGYNLTIVPANVAGVPADSTSLLPPARGTPIARSDAPVERYLALRSLLPYYWLPAIEQRGGDRYAFGLSTSGHDLVGRHAWDFKGVYEPRFGEPGLLGNYAYAGFGMPIARLSGEQFWEHFGLGDSTGARIGTLRRRRAVGDAGLTFARRRVATGISLSVGGSYEWRSDVTDPEPLIDQLDASFRRQRTYPSYFASASFGNARQPALALGPENGVSLGATVRQRWRTGAADATRATTLSGAAIAYRGIDFGGPVHHLLALRVAGAVTDVTSSADFSAGGGSGGSIQLAPGLTFGDGRRTFFVRGAPSGAQFGSHAVGMNAEYRFPIAFPARGLWSTPLFLQRISGALFSDAAAAWCPDASPTSPICRVATRREWIAGVGAELHFDLALQYDMPYRFRFGVAMPASGSRYFGGRSPSMYATVGLPF